MNVRRAAGCVVALLAMAAGVGLVVSLLSLETTRAVIGWLLNGRLPESLTPEGHRRFSQVVMLWSVIGLSLSWIGLTHQSSVHTVARRMGLDFHQLALAVILLNASRDQIVDDATVDIGQAKISTGVAVGQPLVVKA